MKRFKFFLVTVALLLFVSAVPDKTTTIFIIGDSTAANKDISGGKQERGWGMVLLTTSLARRSTLPSRAS